MIDVLVIVNGVYDVVCALCILVVPDDTWVLSSLAAMHKTMLKKNEENVASHPLVRRLLAYWVSCYGFTRLAVITQLPYMQRLAALTYFLEALAWSLEAYVHSSASKSKSLFVIVTSCAMGFTLRFVREALGSRTGKPVTFYTD